MGVVFKESAPPLPTSLTILEFELPPVQERASAQGRRERLWTVRSFDFAVVIAVGAIAAVACIEKILTSMIR